MPSISYNADGDLEQTSDITAKTIIGALDAYRSNRIQYIEYISIVETVCKRMVNVCELDFKSFPEVDYTL